MEVSKASKYHLYLSNRGKGQTSKAHLEARLSSFVGGKLMLTRSEDQGQ